MAKTMQFPPVLISLAVYEPVVEHLTEQLRSIAMQDWPGRIIVFAVVADVQSGPLIETLAADMGLDITLVSSQKQRLDPVRAFEAGLMAAQTWADTQHTDQCQPVFALCDQDDVWHTNRLSEGWACMTETGAALVHGDAHVVDQQGARIHHSMMSLERRSKSDRSRGLLYRNTVTGMTTLIRADVVRTALPFAPQSGIHFYHDLWLALIASSLPGGIARTKQALVNYRQHDANAVGAVDRRRRKTWKALLPSWAKLRRQAGAYSLSRYLALSLQTRLIETSDEPNTASPNNRALKPWLRPRFGVFGHLWDAIKFLASGHWDLAQIAGGFALVNLGRMVWALHQVLTTGLRTALRTFDERLFGLSPGIQPRLYSFETDDAKRGTRSDSHIDQRKIPSWVTQNDPDVVPRVNILVPTLNPSEVFAGIATAIDMGLGLAKRGIPIRFISTDLPIMTKTGSHAFLMGRSQGLSNADIEIFCGVTDEVMFSSPQDRFVASAWWTAHVITHILDRGAFEHGQFHYLLQDFEPNFYPWGPEYADAMASYRMAFIPIFNTTFLRQYFLELGFAFATQAALTFHPAIDVAHYNGSRPDRSGAPKRLALYGRPEVARNMFDTAVEALDLFTTQHGLSATDIELVSVGLQHDPITLSNGLKIVSQGKLPFEQYPDFLRNTDYGLSLMYSPHPSHPPIEMAAAGVRVVTNIFESRDLADLVPTIITTQASAPDLAQGLSTAWQAPPVTESQTHINLTQIGSPFDVMLDALQLDFSALREKVT